MLKYRIILYLLSAEFSHINAGILTKRDLSNKKDSKSNNDVKIVNTAAGAKEVSKAQKSTTSSPVDDILMDIFADAMPSTTSPKKDSKDKQETTSKTTLAPSAFPPNSSTTEGPEDDSNEEQQIEFTRRTSFITRRNCHCIINNRCARTDKC